MPLRPSTVVTTGKPLDIELMIFVAMPVDSSNGATNTRFVSYSFCSSSSDTAPSKVMYGEVASAVRCWMFSFQYGPAIWMCWSSAGSSGRTYGPGATIETKNERKNKRETPQRDRDTQEIEGVNNDGLSR